MNFKTKNNSRFFIFYQSTITVFKTFIYLLINSRIINQISHYLLDNSLIKTSKPNSLDQALINYKSLSLVG